MARRHGNGGDYWATADGRLGVGTPFSTIESLLILYELRVNERHEAVRGALDLLLSAQRDDGRFRLAPSGSIYPCHTANVARVLCRFVSPGSPRIRTTLDHLLAIQQDEGGWRCKKFSGGRGPETEYSNPGVTLFSLDAFRLSTHLNQNTALDAAVDSLLQHWVTRRPIGPCHFGIGTLFMQVEFPFLRYNLFYYLYVLSFYDRAKNDPRFAEALQALQCKLDNRGRVIVERPNRKLSALSFCQKGQTSDLATRRYKEMLKNLGS